jgi:hypothetical protein
MKNLLRVVIFLLISLSILACGQSISATPLPIPSATTTTTVTPTLTPIPGPTATATAQPTSRPEFVPPTLIPTIDPTLVPRLLSEAFSVQTMEGVNGHTVRKITGWDYSFGGGFWEGSCSGYDWLDADHLLLYPATGQVRAFDQWAGTNVVPQPVVISLESEKVWLPPANTSASPLTCNQVYLSRELGILITSETQDGVSTVFTYTYEGRKLSSYTGGIVDVSPSGTKILLGDNTLIDLRTNKRSTLAWSLEDYHEDMLSGLFWTSDEKRIYRCCYFYADLSTGTSYRFERSDFQDLNGNHLDPSGLWFYRGQWVQNDTHFLAQWSWIDDGDIRYLPMLDPAQKIFLDVREQAGISEDWSCAQTTVSPDGAYVWMVGWDGSYLVDLTTFESQYYPRKLYLDIDWSPNSKFAWLYNSDPTDETDQYSIFSIADKEIRPLPVIPSPAAIYWWHENDDTLIYPSEDQKSLIFLDATTMSYREMPFSVQGPPYSFGSFAWDPNGEKIAVVAEDGSIWQVDYPRLENWEQLTRSLPDAGNLNWSPDSNSVSFISGVDIYIVDTMK